MTQPLHIDNSTFNATASCDTRALLRYVHGYTSQDDSLALRAGTAIHTCLEVYFKTGDRKEALKAFRADYEEWAAANVPIDGWPVKYAFENIRDILKTWMRRHPLAQEPYKVFPDLVEVGFSFILDEQEQIYFYGRYDAIVEEKASGQLYVLDHKAQPLWSRLLTPTGWRCMGDVRVGDQVIGGSGAPTTVTGKSRAKLMPTYRVEFNDGGVTYCSDEHLWLVKTPTSKVWTTLKLETLLRRLPTTKFYVPTTRIGHYQNATTTPTAKILPLEPYLVGALIGDGYLNGTCVQFSTAEEEMANHVRRALPLDTQLVKNKGNNYTYVLKRRDQTNSVLNGVRALGMDKHLSSTHRIPADYLYANRVARVDLLQGLMDTDGCISGGYLMYDTISRGLVDDVVELIRSLGGIARWRKRTGTKQQAYRINFRLPDNIIPFRLSRKCARYAQALKKPRKWQLRRYIKSITRVADEICQCITVADETACYFTDDHIVTHNSTGQITSDWAHAFKLSTQMTGYVWAAQQLLGGKRVSGAIINGIQVSKLPDIKYKLNGEVYKCREHGVGIDECRLTHTKESLAITQRDPHEIEGWKRDAVRLAKKYRRLVAKYPTVESVSTAPQQGKFANACKFCDFKAYCEVGRPAAQIATMLKHEPWRAYDVRAAAKEAGSWERK